MHKRNRITTYIEIEYKKLGWSLDYMYSSSSKYFATYKLNDYIRQVEVFRDRVIVIETHKLNLLI